MAFVYAIPVPMSSHLRSADFFLTAHEQHENLYSCWRAAYPPVRSCVVVAHLIEYTRGRSFAHHILPKHSRTSYGFVSAMAAPNWRVAAVMG